jgi:hypothetical protein
MDYISKHNKDFIRFKNIHSGRDSIVFCTGPTLNKFNFKSFPKDTINVGVNKIYKSEHISKVLDYYFFGSHYHIDTPHRNGIHSLRESNPSAMFLSSTFTAKFGDGRETGLGNINKRASDMIGALPFEVGAPNSGPGLDWVKEIDKHPFYGGSIAFPAVQFLLYTGVKRIYLVGCDLGNSNVHFHNSDKPTQRNDGASSFYLSGWKKLPNFLKNNYPNTEVITVNPVGLKGIFGEIYV